MKRFILTFFGAFLMILPPLGDVNAQQADKQNEQNQQKATRDDLENADVLIIANIRARELKFEAVPNTSVEFFGKPERRTFWEADRENLPRPVEPGVTYRNIGIQLRIVSRFADIERIVAEALGEIPVSDDAPTANRQNAPPEEKAQSQNKPKLEIIPSKKPR